jgi:hypothetical protein
MSKRRLPLDSPNWRPLTEVHRFVCEQTGDRRLANRDLTNAMADGRVRSMARWLEPPLRANEPERELLPPTFWAKEWQLHCQLLDFLPEPFVPLKGRVLYVWKPDCKKIFGLGVALQDAKESVHEKVAKTGRPQTIRRQELREEIMRRCWQKGRFIAPESHMILITELQAWHKRKFKNEPNYDDLRKFVGDAIAILKLAGK